MTDQIEMLKSLLPHHPAKHHGLIARCVVEGMDPKAIRDAILSANRDDAVLAHRIEHTEACLGELKALRAGRTVSNAMKMAMEAGVKLRGAALREHVLRLDPGLARA